MCEDNDVKILNGPFMYYEDCDDKNHRYFVDFEIEVDGKKRLIEIKSTYWFKQYRDRVIKKTIRAQKWSKENGYLPFKLLIRDKEYKTRNWNNKWLNIIKIKDI